MHVSIKNIGTGLNTAAQQFKTKKGWSSRSACCKLREMMQVYQLKIQFLSWSRIHSKFKKKKKHPWHNTISGWLNTKEIFSHHLPQHAKIIHTENSPLLSPLSLLCFCLNTLYTNNCPQLYNLILFISDLTPSVAIMARPIFPARIWKTHTLEVCIQLGS